MCRYFEYFSVMKVSYVAHNMIICFWILRRGGKFTEPSIVTEIHIGRVLSLKSVSKVYQNLVEYKPSF